MGQIFNPNQKHEMSKVRRNTRPNRDIYEISRTMSQFHEEIEGEIKSVHIKFRLNTNRSYMC